MSFRQFCRTQSKVQMNEFDFVKLQKLKKIIIFLLRFDIEYPMIDVRLSKQYCSSNMYRP